MSVFIIRFLPVIVFIILVLVWYLLAKNKSQDASLKKAPWFIFIITIIGWYFGKLKLASLCLLMSIFIVTTGLWEKL